MTKDVSLREYSRSSDPNIFELNTTMAISGTKFDSQLGGGVRLCGKWGEALRKKGEALLGLNQAEPHVAETVITNDTTRKLVRRV